MRNQIYSKRYFETHLAPKSFDVTLTWFEKHVFLTVLEYIHFWKDIAMSWEIKMLFATYEYTQFMIDLL